MFCKLIAGGLLVGIALSVSAQDKLIMASGAVQQGTIIKVDANTVTIRLPAGDIALPRKDIARVELQKPAEVDAALKAVETKKCAESIPVLKAVTAKYMNLNEPWLEQAYGALGDCLASTGDSAGAVDTYRKFMQYFPQSKAVLKAKVGLAQGLVKEAKYDEALQLIEPAVEPLRKELSISPADNFFMGSAMIVLGDCYQAKGGAENLEKALDCYLSTVVVYYRDAEAVRQAQKKADALKELIKKSEKSA